MKIAKKNRRSLAEICAIVLLFLFFLWHMQFSTTPNCTYESRARSEVQDLAIAVKVFLREMGEGGKNTEEVECLSKFMISNLVENLYLDKTFSINTNTWEWYDPWGEPYKIVIRNLQSDVFLPRGFPSNVNIIISSKGENRVDDNYAKDDVYYFF